MTTKDKLLELLESKKGEFLSGEELAKQLFVSRNAVWKAVNSLKNEGYHILSQKNRGYSLAANNDILSQKGIRQYLDSGLSFMKFHLYSQVNSTNTVLQEKVMNPNEETSEGMVILSSAQFKGRGRRGKVFYSPNDSGIYMSLLLRPENFGTKSSLLLSTTAAVSICEAIEELSSNLHPQIKWVNDIFINNRKVCGILTEAQLELESNTIDYVILGIGINFYMPSDDFPKELKNIAGSVFQDTVNDGKNKLIAGFLNHFMNYYSKIKKETAKKSPKSQSSSNSIFNELLKKYKERCFVIGKEILVISQQEEKSAFAVDIDEEYRLIVRFDDNSPLTSLSSGEISTVLK